MKGAGLVIAGVVLGVLVTSHVWIVASRLLRESPLAAFQNEQLLLASRARKSGDAFRQVLHAMNAADAQAEIGFRWLQWARAETYWGWFRFPWSSFPLIWNVDPYFSASETAKVGRDSLESVYRAQAAIAFEQFGRADLAGDQWSRATELKPEWSVEDLRALVDAGSSSLNDQYESAYLDSATFKEHLSALERIRSSAQRSD